MRGPGQWISSGDRILLTIVIDSKFARQQATEHGGRAFDIYHSKSKERTLSSEKKALQQTQIDPEEIYIGPIQRGSA